MKYVSTENFEKIPWKQKLKGYLYACPQRCQRLSSFEFPWWGFGMLQSLRILVHVYMQALSWNSVKVVMDADPQARPAERYPLQTQFP